MLKSTGGINLFTQNYFVDKPVGNILLVHGLAEHCGRYAHVADALNKIGLNVYSFDLRGHGKSDGPRAFVKSIDEFREDVEVVYNSIPKDLPTFILGHSLGGLITLNFLMFRERTDIDGVIFSGAALEIGEDITPFTQKVVTFLAKIAPKLPTVKLDPKTVSRDLKEVEKYANDPLNYHGGTKAGLGLAMLNGINKLKSQFKDFTYPVLIMHGEGDKLANPEGSKALYSQCTSTDKTLKIWDGAFHEIFNEINKNEIIQYTTHWIKERI
ncbi:lysophospholipase [Lacihabitans sp. LS3-19]|uniref:alpha/beta hydrolase n=1 Tax=Lacihabitans sp. LS3-19 TaxID=2487335 RepID=UPI0020CCD5FE|nr:alpha/beta hydrolase [Lacihabitans sp. LS3-19]MCP9766400.1 lysophospholipase [Lacihabitans sp. LS3-19]